MRAHVISSPPLGQHTVVGLIHGGEDDDDDDDKEHYAVEFHVALEFTTSPSAEFSHSDHGWSVEVWHDHLSVSTDDEWTALPLHADAARSTRGADFLCADETRERVWFYGVLVGRPRLGRRTKFTIRFCRNDDDDDEGARHCWRWATRQGGGYEDGVLLYRSPSFPSRIARRLDDYVPLPRDRRLSVLRRRSETPETLLWLVTAAECPAASEGTSGWGEWHLGRPRRVEKWFALTRVAVPWLGPRQGRGELADGESVVYAFLRDDGLHVVVLALSAVQTDGHVQATLCRSVDRRRLVLVARNDDEEPRAGRVVVSVGGTFDVALAAAMYEARKLVMSLLPPEEEDMSAHGQPENMHDAPGDQSILTSDPGPTEQHGGPVQKQQQQPDLRASWFQEWIDGFTYCTWNSIGLALSQEKILGALASLENAGISVSNLIIDDGWQGVDKPGESNMLQGWDSFEADRTKFPDGLRGFIDKVKSINTSLRHVVVWHALLGYWNGLARSGQIARRYSTRDVPVRNGAMISDGCMQIVDADDCAGMYADFYHFLERAGVSATKTDVQFALDELCRPKDRRELMTAYVHAWQNNYLGHFAGRSIGCMSQTPWLIFGACLRSDLGPAIPVRNSADFAPDDDSNHPWHVWCNAHNAVLSSFLNIIPDWDMFQTAHAWGSWHAAARCLSGGPVYTTDESGNYDTDLIRRITAKSPRGETVILRPSVAGRTANVYAGYEDEQLCRINSYNGAADTGAGMMGLFNMKDKPLSEMVRVDEFMGVLPGRSYLVRSYRRQRTSRIFHGPDLFGIEISGYEWDILTAHQVHAVDAFFNKECKHRQIWITPLGLVDHLVGNTVLTGWEVDVRPPLPDTVGKLDGSRLRAFH